MLKIIRTILKPVDYFLNRITMYRLVLYILIAFLVVAEIYDLFGLLPQQPMALVFSTVYILTICWIVNKFFSFMFDAPANVESVYITALILALIISPIQGLGDTAFYSLAAWASILAISSKFILAIRKKHVFNPAALGVAITALVLGLSATWWVGTGLMLPFVLVGGLLIVKMIRRFDLVLGFLAAAVVMILGYAVIKQHDVLGSLQAIVFDTPIFFFAFVMLTEPLTTPPTRSWRVAYGALVGVLFAPFVNLLGIFSTPELALLVGNIFSYIVSPKYKLMLKLNRREEVARDTYDFVFGPDRRISFEPGQYLEWTLAHEPSDSRGVRRYFTIASAPTESEIRIGVKFYPEPSTLKRALYDLKAGQTIVGSQLSGDFTLPKDQNQKLAFIAGGIGVTPFRSMIKYLIDTDERRDIVMFYSNRELADIAYTDIFDQAYDKFGLKTIYTLTDKAKAPASWRGRVGFFDADSIKQSLPDYMDRVFYLSGPQSLVLAFEETLGKLGVHRSHIKTDYFPGFA